jgi:Flp pilus assembly protein TadG
MNQAGDAMTDRPGMFRRFLRSERGSFTVEAVVIFPLLVWAYTAMFVFWDAFKTQNINLKATYTIADMISREQELICNSYIEGARSIYAFLSPGDTNHQIRVTSVRQLRDEDDNVEWEFWSFATSGMVPYTELDQFQDIMPMMADFDSLLIVNTATDWTPSFNAGLSAMTLSETVVTSPRFQSHIEICPAAAAFTGSGT